MLETTKELRPNSLIPPYPNYHIGEYFEEFFFRKFSEEYSDLTINGRKYIPIFWTNCYTNKVFSKINYEIQSKLNSLPQDEKYFIISQHDDCVYEKLPINTLIFSMGGNKVGDNIIPLPLICSPLLHKSQEKNIEISFVGSLTHPIRETLYNSYKGNRNFQFYVKNWELKIDDEKLNIFFDITSRSKFTLCPRGYGKSSFRLYESMQLDSIPIYVYDEPWLPWENEIDWDRLILKVPIDEIRNLEYNIKNIDKDLFISYKNEIYDQYFSFEGVYNNIIKILSNGNI